MLTAGDALAKTLAKSQKIIFWSQKNSFRATPAVSQNREQKSFLDAKGEKRCSSSGAIT